jgi:hypothetical protein
MQSCPKCFSRIGPSGLSGSVSASLQNQGQIQNNPEALPVLGAVPPPIPAGVSSSWAPPLPMSWRGKAVQVRAISVPRYLWTSASIDVYLDGERVFRTGGKINPTGGHAETVRIGGAEHRMEVTWGLSRGFKFPYQLKIDGELVVNSVVKVENGAMIFIPSTLIVLVIFSIIGVVIWLLSHVFNLANVVSGNAR